MLIKHSTQHTHTHTETQRQSKDECLASSPVYTHRVAGRVLSFVTVGNENDHEEDRLKWPGSTTHGQLSPGVELTTEVMDRTKHSVDNLQVTLRTYEMYVQISRRTSFSVYPTRSDRTLYECILDFTSHKFLGVPHTE